MTNEFFRSLFVSAFILGLVFFGGLWVGQVARQAVEDFHAAHIAPAVPGAVSLTSFKNAAECRYELSVGPNRIMSETGAARYCQSLPVK